MKTGIAILAVVMVAGVASAQGPDASKWMCRNLAESGGFLYQGETVFGAQACRPIQQAPAAQAALVQSKENVKPAAAEQPVAAEPQSQVAANIAPVAPAALTNAAPVAPAVPAAVTPAASAASPVATVNDGKKRLYVTDEPKDESIFLASHRSGWQVNGSSNGNVNGSGGSAGGAYGYSQNGADPRTVELQADLYKTCPSITVTNDPSRADYVLLFRREGGKRSSMFAFGGLTGLALSAHSKVDGASVFDTTGDMIFATRARTVETAIKEVCGHLN